MNAVIWLIYTILEVCFFIVIAHVILSWLIMFNILDMRNNIVQQIWHGLARLTDPIYKPIRRFLPDLGGIDLAPLIVLLGIMFLQRLLVSDIAPVLS